MLAPLPVPRSGFLAVALLALAGCGGDDMGAPGLGPGSASPPAPTTLTFDFATRGNEWTAGFAEYNPGRPEQIAFETGVRDLPPPLTVRRGLLLAGTNASGDLFMFAWRKIENLSPGREYRIAVELEFATNAAAGCAGIGGPPGESVYIKAGASGTEPRVATTGAPLVVGLDKGNQAQSGSDAVVIGDFASPDAGSCTDPRYATKQLATGDDAPVVAANNSGELWLVLGTDSGFEGRTGIYLLEAEFTLTRE